MDNWFEFIVERYNYWIAITLMMMGLYIVFARGNLVKKIVGLNLFQTSVFIFYITIGKIAGGTAPIYMGGELDHGSAPEGGHDATDPGAPDASATDAHGKISNDVAHGLKDKVVGGADSVSAHGEAVTDSLHGKIDNTLGDLSANDLKSALGGVKPSEMPASGGLHDAPVDAPVDAAKIGNDALAGLKPETSHGTDGHGSTTEGPAADGFEAVTDGHDKIANEMGDIAHGVAEGAAGHADVIYSNPLPHVLILTAIVVGVATTAVGLALAVRIREAYGTIEEDELEAIDDIAEFGQRPGSHNNLSEELGGAA